MKKLSIILLILICLANTSKGWLLTNIVTLQNLNYNFIPENELDYVNYLKIMLGRSDKPTKPSEAIQSFISVNDINEEKIVEKIVLVFMNSSRSK